MAAPTNCVPCIVSTFTRGDVDVYERSRIFNIYTSIDLEVTYVPIANPESSEANTTEQRIDTYFTNGIVSGDGSISFRREDLRTNRTCLEKGWNRTRTITRMHDLVNVQVSGEVLQIKRFKGPRLPECIRKCFAFMCNPCC